MKPTLLSFLLAAFCFNMGVSQDRIYWGNQNDDNIRSVVASDLSGATTVGTVMNPSGLAYYHANPTYPLFYAANTIYRHNLAGTANQIIAPTGQFNRGIAIDYDGKKIYWVNSQNNYLGSANLDGSDKNEGFITGLNTPYDVEIDPVENKIYWCEANSDGSGDIRRANLSDGSNIETLVENVYSQGLGIDPVRRKLFYTIFTTGPNVYSADIDGNGVQGPIGTLTAISDIDVDVATGTLYMIDYGSNGLTKSSPDATVKTTIAVSGTYVAYADVTVPVISSVARQAPAGGNVGAGGAATFRVTFSEPVLNVDATDFEFTGTANTDITVSPVSLHFVYDVTVRDITGPGTLDLDIAAAHDIFDFRGNAFEGTITAEETYTIITAPSPVITSFDPAGGSEGTIVTISGTGFSAVPADNTVTFNNVSAVVSASTSTTITANVPAGATTGPITVSVLGLTATSPSTFSVCQMPPVPTITRQENVLTSSAEENNQWLKGDVEIPGAIAKTLVVTDAGNYAVRVSSGMCSAVSSAFTVAEADLTPDIFGFSPESGERGTVIVINGTDFSATPANNIVTIGGVTAAVTSSTATSITTSVPTATPLGAGNITVMVNGRTATGATAFTVLCSPPPKPTISTNGGILTSSSNSNNQWLKNGEEISGATGETYTATAAGAYSVRVTVEGCSTESDPTAIVGIEESQPSWVNIYPNPATSVVHVELQSAVAEATVEVYSLTGILRQKVRLSAQSGTTKGELNVHGYATGIYLTIITTEKGRIVRKFHKP